MCRQGGNMVHKYENAMIEEFKDMIDNETCSVMQSLVDADIRMYFYQRGEQFTKRRRLFFM